jgi:hypothetical protein
MSASRSNVLKTERISVSRDAEILAPAHSSIELNVDEQALEACGSVLAA